MSLSAAAIDRIVANVLNRIDTTATSDPARTLITTPIAATIPSSASTKQVSLNAAVITASEIDLIPANSVVIVQSRAIVTPAAWDAIKQRRVQLQRETARDHSAAGSAATSTYDPSGEIRPLLIVVRNDKVVEQIWAGLTGSWRRELSGCPDDAARLAISEICRGAAPTAVILAEQSYRAACLANRHEQVKAAVVHDVREIQRVRQQIRANVWCIDPVGRSYFELKNVFQQIQQAPKKAK